MLNKKSKIIKTTLTYLGRRRFLRNVSLITLGVVTAIVETLLGGRNKKAIAKLSPKGADIAIKQTRDSITDIWGKRTPYINKWLVRADQRVTEEPERWVQSACVLCSYGCALDIGVREGKIVGVRGREVDRVNQGRLGPRLFTRLGC